MSSCLVYCPHTLHQGKATLNDDVLKTWQNFKCAFIRTCVWEFCGPANLFLGTCLPAAFDTGCFFLFLSKIFRGIALPWIAEMKLVVEKSLKRTGILLVLLLGKLSSLAIRTIYLGLSWVPQVSIQVFCICWWGENLMQKAAFAWCHLLWVWLHKYRGYSYC